MIMLYMIGSFVISGLIGTVIALRLMALDAMEQPSSLTVRGKVVLGLSIGIGVGLFVVLFNGMWWDCDLTQPDSACRLYWGY
jgi:hypothetical protein